MTKSKNPQMQAGLAIAGVLVQRYIFYPLITISFMLLLIAALFVYMSVVHTAWWMLLLIVALLWLGISLLFLLVSFAATKALQPRNLKYSEKKLVIQFAKDFGIKYAAAKGIKKSPTALAGIVTWKFMRGRGKTSVSGIVTQPISDAKELKSRFDEIVSMFSDDPHTKC